MKTDTDKQIEQLVDKMMKDVTLETPSLDFTTKVMTKVLDVKANTVTTYKPLISKKIWYSIFTGILVLVLYVSFSGTENSNNFLDTLNSEILQKFNPSKLFSGVHFSRTTAYACVLLALMLLVQIPILKWYTDRRLDI